MLKKRGMTSKWTLTNKFLLLSSINSQPSQLTQFNSLFSSRSSSLLNSLPSSLHQFKLNPAVASTSILEVDSSMQCHHHRLLLSLEQLKILLIQVLTSIWQQHPNKKR
mmetsp:Transcript_4847/g.7288  ORF Transcript_4847/g.7288 Transcript_4847/m.7288 type:complete len:108 (-) Transcript_4847:2184-2507(-)